MEAITYSSTHNPFTIWFYCSSHQEVKSVPPFPESCFDQQNVLEITLFDFQNLDHQEDLNFRSSPSWNTVLRPSYKEAGLIYWRWKAMWKTLKTSSQQAAPKPHVSKIILNLPAQSSCHSQPTGLWGAYIFIVVRQ